MIDTSYILKTVDKMFMRTIFKKLYLKINKLKNIVWILLTEKNVQI